MPLDTMRSKLRVAKLQLILAQVLYFVAQSQSGIPHRMTNLRWIISTPSKTARIETHSPNYPKRT